MTPLARSTTSGGRSSYLRLATNAAKSRLSDMAASFDMAVVGAASVRGIHSDDHLFVASTECLAQPVGVVRPVAAG